MATVANPAVPGTLMGNTPGTVVNIGTTPTNASTTVRSETPAPARVVARPFKPAETSAKLRTGTEDPEAVVHPLEQVASGMSARASKFRQDSGST